MPRAKRTDRTEARRRYRAEQAALAAEEPGAEAAARTSAEPGSKTPAAPAKRQGIMSTFRAAYHPAHIREDLRSLPLVVTNWGFLAAVGGSLIAVVWFIVAYAPALSSIPAPASSTDLQGVVQANVLPYYLGTMVLQGPPAVGAFVIGFTAKRASWLGGLIYGIYTVILVVIVLQTEAGRLLTLDGSPEAVVVSAAAWAPMSACLFAAALAWYRRFLDLSNPNRRAAQGRGQQGKAKPKQKPAR